MKISTKLAVRCAVELCAIMCDEGKDGLASNAAKLLSEKEINGVSNDNIQFEIDHNLAARLFSSYKNTPDKVKKANLIKELLRKIWLADILVNNPAISVADLLKEVSKKYQEEKSFEPELTAQKFLLFEIMDFQLNKDEAIKETSREYTKFSNYFPRCYSILAGVFDKLNGLSYMHDIYNEKTGGIKLIHTENAVSSLDLNPEASPETDELQPKPATIPEEEKTPSNTSAAAEKRLRDTIRILENEKHNLEVKAAFAKKDAIRDFIFALTDYSWGAPLSELYLLSRDENTPERIKGTIKNLFMALSSENIRLVKEKQVGTTIILNEENQKAFDPYKNEELFLTDEATIYYPGYRFDRETMVKPVVRKKNTNQEVE